MIDDGKLCLPIYYLSSKLSLLCCDTIVTIHVTCNYIIMILIRIGPKGPNFSRHWKKWDYIYFLKTKGIIPLSASSQSKLPWSLAIKVQAHGCFYATLSLWAITDTRSLKLIDQLWCLRKWTLIINATAPVCFEISRNNELDLKLDLIRLWLRFLV